LMIALNSVIFSTLNLIPLRAENCVNANFISCSEKKYPYFLVAYVVLCSPKVIYKLKLDDNFYNYD
jgi:hypothetical protein